MGQCTDDQRALFSTLTNSIPEVAQPKIQAKPKVGSAPAKVEARTASTVDQMKPLQFKVQSKFEVGKFCYCQNMFTHRVVEIGSEKVLLQKAEHGHDTDDTAEVDLDTFLEGYRFASRIQSVVVLKHSESPACSEQLQKDAIVASVAATLFKASCACAQKVDLTSVLEYLVNPTDVRAKRDVEKGALKMRGAFATLFQQPSRAIALALFWGLLGCSEALHQWAKLELAL